MNNLEGKYGVWFIYDGDCPICAYAAEALHIKQKFGSLSILNVREISSDPLIDEINRRGLDLDEGMVIYLDSQFYYGKEALKFIARHGKNNNLLMLLFKSFFWSDKLSRLVYPWMSAARNGFLRYRKATMIDNLNLKEEPIFKSIFGESWNDLPLIMKKHYANKPYTEQVITVKGRLNVFCKPPLSWLSPLMRLMGQIPAFNANNVPVTVRFESDFHSKSFHFNRAFNFRDRKTYIFHSRMFQIKENEVIEIMKFGLGWKMHYSWDGEKVVLEHRGYALQVLGHLIPLPLSILMGAGHAVEYPVDDNTFDMEVRITHPWWGEVYGYKGRFEVLQ